VNAINRITERNILIGRNRYGQAIASLNLDPTREAAIIEERRST